MRWTEHYIVYPEGDVQEISHPLTLMSLVGLNGEPLPLPLTTARQIVYRVVGQRTRETRNGEERYYLLEQVSVEELEEFLG